jgi:hypothetical protein
VGEAPTYEGVQTTSVEFISLAGLPFSGRKIKVLPIASGLIGLDALSTDFLHEQSAYGKGTISDKFGIDPKAGLTGIMTVPWVVFGEASSGKRTLAVGFGGDDRLDQCLNIPFAVPEAG